MMIRPGVDVANLTDVGCQRENNEDFFCYVEPEHEDEFLRKGRLAVVADGMGGHAAGQVASRIAVETVRETYLGDSVYSPQEALIIGLRTAHDRIQREASESAELDGMGTTCTAAAIIGRNLVFAHVGDTRLYLVRNGEIRQLTHDHSYVNRLLEAGMLTPEQAREHPQRNVLITALGAGDFGPADFPAEPVPLDEGDLLLLCTDGLSGLVRNEEMLDALMRFSPSEACNRLVELAKSRGGPDNITLQVLRIGVDGSRQSAAAD